MSWYGRARACQVGEGTARKSNATVDLTLAHARGDLSCRMSRPQVLGLERGLRPQPMSERGSS
eukprot:3292886-Alexandrium_andersonii.AAC.1